MTVSQQRRLLINSQNGAGQTKRGAMMNVGFRLLRGGDSRCQIRRLNQSVNQSEESPAERRARGAVFSSQLEGAELHIQIDPPFDWEPISTGNSQSISRATEMDFERPDFLEIFSYKCFKPISAKRFFAGESLNAERMAQPANRQNA